MPVLRHRQQLLPACEGTLVRERVRHPELRTHLIGECPQLSHENTVRLPVLPHQPGLDELSPRDGGMPPCGAVRITGR
jgi:hypothetical protein